jgi:hypothetical protein
VRVNGLPQPRVGRREQESTNLGFDLGGTPRGIGLFPLTLGFPSLSLGLPADEVLPRVQVRERIGVGRFTLRHW